MDEQELNELGWTRRPTWRQVVSQAFVPVVGSLLLAGIVGFWCAVIGGTLNWPLLALVLPPVITGVVSFLYFTVSFDRSRPTGMYWRLD